MLKRKIDKYLQDWKKLRNKPLLVTGARQIGKTYSIEHFGKTNFENFVEINFVSNNELTNAVARMKKADDLIIILNAYFGNLLIPDKTLIFLDEIQIVYELRERLIENKLIDYLPIDIISTMKDFCINRNFRIVLSGSLLGVNLHNIISYPVGYMDEYEMYPLDFEEFLWAKGCGELAINHINKCFNDLTPVSEEINKLFLHYFKEYVLIGGMPEAIETYIKTLNLYQVNLVHKSIVKNYEKDIVTYINERTSILKLVEVFKRMPSEINSKNKRFIYSSINDINYVKRNGLNNEFLWLSNAGVAIPVYNVTNPEIPLVASSERTTLKLFMNDTGLLNSLLLSTGVTLKLLNDEKEINWGAPYENACAIELNSHGFNNCLYYFNSKKHGEVDFLIEYASEVLPIEIKSGKPNSMNIYNHTALNNMLKTYPIKKAFILGNCNVKKETEKIYTLPIYMIMFIKQYKDY